MSPSRPSLFVLSTLVVMGASACAPPPKQARALQKTVVEKRRDGTTVDDHALCDYKGKKDVEVSETAGAGAIQPNVRRVYRLVGVGSDRRKVLSCREVDTNLDGMKDVVRLYTDDGQSKEERADSNYDGKLDTWNLFSKGRLAEVRLDTNFDGEPDEWKVYVDGKLSRVKLDKNFDKKPDVWEMYRAGRLERIGVDLDGDERVDRWDRDGEWLKKLAQADQRKQDEEQKRRQEEAEKRIKEAEEATTNATEGGEGTESGDSGRPTKPRDLMGAKKKGSAGGSGSPKSP
ncbi:MAG: hypothetical protein FJ096_21545 [Deltaproteobacteria bacterium]|nr:hypothetical protein [Deltaproteobacteria bacterium]